MPNQEQQREDKLRNHVEAYFNEITTDPIRVNKEWIINSIFKFAKSPEVAAFHRTPVEVEALRAEFEKLYANGDIISINNYFRDSVFNFFLPHLQPSGESEAVAILKWEKEFKDPVKCCDHSEWLRRVALSEKELYTEFLKHKQLKK